MDVVEEHLQKYNKKNQIFSIQIQKTLTADSRALACSLDALKTKYFLCHLLSHGLRVKYLIEEGVVSPLDPCPVGLSAHINLHHWLDVVARQLTSLDDPDTNLKDKEKKNYLLNFKHPDYFKHIK